MAQIVCSPFKKRVALSRNKWTIYWTGKHGQLVTEQAFNEDLARKRAADLRLWLLAPGIRDGVHLLPPGQLPPRLQGKPKGDDVAAEDQEAKP